MPSTKNPEEPVKNTAEAPEQKPKKRTGRPQVPIDRTEFEYLVSCGCTLKMIAGFYAMKYGSCSDDTIVRWCKRTYGKTFYEVSSLYKEGGKSRLLMKQMEVALNGSEKMLIWLGKVRLGQSENGMQETNENKTSKLYEVLDADDDEETNSETN